MYSVAICTHNRADTVGRKVLRYLQESSVPRSRVHLFVTPGQEEEYERLVPPDLYGHLHTGGGGLANNRNSVVKYFPAGERVIQFDDDVTALMRLTPNGKLAQVKNADDLFHQAFEITSRMSATIWGVYPVCNAFYMKDRVSAGLLFLIGQCMGFLNRPEELISINDKDDYERSLLRFESDGAVIRFDGLAAKTGGVRKNSGGLQNEHRLRNNNEATHYLLNRWPGLVQPKKPRPDGYLEIRLRNPSKRIDN